MYCPLSHLNRDLRYIDADQFCFWQPFRADDGTTVQDRSLSLQLCDFAPKSCFANLSQVSRSTAVQIIYGQLCSFLHDAETRNEIKRRQQGKQVALPRNCRKRIREATPPEALSPRTEAKISKREVEEVAKSEAQDSSWE